MNLGGRDATHEGRRADHRLSDRQRYSLCLRHLRPRQCRHARSALRGARPHQARFAAPRAGRGPYGGRLFPGAPSAGGDADLVRAGLGQYRHAAGLRADRFLGRVRHHRQCADLAVQPQPVPGDQPAFSGRFRQCAAPGGEAQFSADPRRHAAAGAAPGHDHDAVRPAGPGEYRRAVQRLSGRRRRRDAAAGAAV